MARETRNEVKKSWVIWRRVEFYKGELRESWVLWGELSSTIYIRKSWVQWYLTRRDAASFCWMHAITCLHVEIYKHTVSTRKSGKRTNIQSNVIVKLSLLPGCEAMWQSAWYNQWIKFQVLQKWKWVHTANLGTNHTFHWQKNVAEAASPGDVSCFAHIKICLRQSVLSFLEFRHRLLESG